MDFQPDTQTNKLHAAEQVKGILGACPYIPLYRPCKSSLFFDAFFPQTQRREIRNNTEREREGKREKKRETKTEQIRASHFMYGYCFNHELGSSDFYLFFS